MGVLVSPKVLNANAFVLKSGIHFKKNINYAFFKALKNVIKMDLVSPFLKEMKVCFYIFNKFLNFQYFKWIFCGPLDPEGDCTCALQDSYCGNSEIS